MTTISQAAVEIEKVGDQYQVTLRFPEIKWRCPVPITDNKIANMSRIKDFEVVAMDHLGIAEARKQLLELFDIFPKEKA